MVFFLFGCTNSQEETKEEIEYIDPARDIFIFGELDYSLQKRIKEANNNNDYKNYQFNMLFKDGYDGEVVDINGNIIKPSEIDELIVEVVSVECSHCKKQLETITDMMNNLDKTFIQYFNVGNREEILEFYGDIDIPENLIIVSYDGGFKDYLIDEIGIKMYPTLLTFKNNQLSFCAEGETSMIAFRYICDIGFNNILKEEDFIDADGNNVLKINRSIDDVKNDLSIENQNKIKSLDNDNYTEELTYTLMSKQLYFDKISNRKSDVYINEIEDYSVYKDKQLVLLYTFLRDNSQTDRVEFINEIIDDNPDMNFIVVLIEGLESSSAALRNMNIRFKCPVVSTLGMMPDDFFRFGISSYPTAIFVNEGVFVGGYSNIESKEKFKEAISVFLSEDSVAYKKNN